MKVQKLRERHRICRHDGNTDDSVYDNNDDSVNDNPNKLYKEVRTSLYNKIINYLYLIITILILISLPYKDPPFIIRLFIMLS